MNYLILLIAVTWAGGCSLAVAADTVTSTTSAETSTSVKSIQKRSRADLDTEVTDAKLRADSGSKSRYSGAFKFNYAGGSFADPLSENRPFYGRGVPDPVEVSGNLGVRYRMNKNESVWVSSGFSQEKPFHDGTGSIELYDPTIMYNNTFAAGDIQIGNTVSTTVTTLERFRNVGKVGSVGYTLSAILPMHQSGFAGGIMATLWYAHYRSGYEHESYRQLDYGFHISPTLQYNFSSNFNINTYVSALSLSHSRDRNDLDMVSYDVEQSIGLAWAPVRDIYLSPYVNFLWTDMNADRTTVNLQATINVF